MAQPVENPQNSSNSGLSSWALVYNADANRDALFSRYYGALLANARKHVCRLPNMQSQTAEDLVQEFIVHMLKVDLFAMAVVWRNQDPARKKLRFRQYLYRAFYHYAVSKARQGDKIHTVSLESLNFVPQPNDESQFDKNWARSVIDLAMSHFRERCLENGEESLVQVLMDRFQTPQLTYAEIARKHGFRTVGKTTYQVRKARGEFQKSVRQILQLEAFDDPAYMKQLIHDLEASASSADADSGS